jgi:mono/diheme cytochrome c family protein
MPSGPNAPPKDQRTIVWVLILFVVVAAGGATYLYMNSGWRIPAAAKNTPNPVAANSEAVAAGKTIYARDCANCHGDRGDGKGKKAPDLSIAPADFTDRSSMSRLTDGELYWQISEGRRPMPAFKDKLTEQERWQVVTFIRTFVNSPTAGAR